MGSGGNITFYESHRVVGSQRNGKTTQGKISLNIGETTPECNCN